TEDVKEKEIVEDYLNREFSAEDGNESNEAPEERKTRKEETIKEINESTYRSLTCNDILDSLEQSIDIYDRKGDLGVLEYFSELQGDAYFKACLKSNDGFKHKFNDLYMSLSEIRNRKDEEAARAVETP
ncbi:MAG: hypothetical protein ABR572_11555, partial [Cryomorphaceae bacterium]|nr:hypothetical protein [Flavobacteriales bacterium]